MIWNQNNEIHLRVDSVLYRMNTFQSYHQDHRKNNGIVFYVHGGHTVKWGEEGNSSIMESQLLYLPYGSQYSSTLISKETEYYEIDFSLFQNGKQVPLLDDIRTLTKVQSAKYLNEIKDIYDCFIQEKPNFHLVILSKLLKLCSMLCNEDLFTEKESEGFERIRRAIAYIQDHFDDDFTVEDLARISYISVSTLEKSFLTYLGETPSKYRNRIRIRHAQMLLKGGFSVSDTAQKVGFSNRNYFSNVFKKMTGTTPAKYQTEAKIDTL